MERGFISTLVCSAAFAIAASFPLPSQTLLGQAPAADLPELETGDATDQPVAVISVSGVNAVGDAMIFLADAAGQPAAGGMFAAMANGFTRGIDPDRPMGMVVKMVEGAPSPLLFVPSSDISKFLKTMEGRIGPAEKLEEDPNTMVIAAGPSLLYIKQAGDWAFASQGRDALKDLPEDPLTLLGDMPTTYDIAVRVNVQQVPSQQREMLIAALKQGFEAGMARQIAGQGSDVEEGRRVAESTLKQLEAEIQFTDSLLFGFSVDTERARMFVDIASTATEGSDTAEIYSNTIPLPSKFASVIDPNAAAYYHASQSVSPKAVERMRSSLEQSMQVLRGQIANEENLSGPQKDEVIKVVRRIADLGIATIEEGKVDMGLKIDLESGRLKMQGGAFVADGTKIADMLKELAAQLQNDPQAPKFSFDESEYKEVTLHSIVANISDDKAQEVLGDELVVKLGTASDAVYFAVGADAEASLKALIDSAPSDEAGTKRPLGQFYMALAPFIRMVDRIDSNDVVTAMLQAATNSEETDRVLLITNPIERGQAMRLIIGEGILRAAGAAAVAAQQQQAPAGF